VHLVEVAADDVGRCKFAEQVVACYQPSGVAWAVDVQFASAGRGAPASAAEYSSGQQATMAIASYAGKLQSNRHSAQTRSSGTHRMARIVVSGRQVEVGATRPPLVTSRPVSASPPYAATRSPADHSVVQACWFSGGGCLGRVECWQCRAGAPRRGAGAVTGLFRSGFGL
jgi:hypothetical protein